MVLPSWSACHAEVNGVSNAVFKKFPTYRQAESFAFGTDHSEKRAEKSTPTPQEEVVVYTDGACPDQHTGIQETRVSGCGVWFGHGDERNVGVPNPYPPHTNNRAEMAAVLLAMQAFGKHQPKRLCVMSDSEYVVKGMNEWMAGWKARRFAKVKNADLWQKLDDMRHEIGNVRFVHVRGHCGIEGNEEADRLANQGARMCETAQK